MLQGLTTLNHYVDDVPAAAAWYTKVLGVAPYFANPATGTPAYVEFRVGPDEDEFGLVDARFRPPTLAGAAPAGSVTYWHVADVAASHETLLELGAAEVEAVTARGDQGWVTSIVADPWGNLIGLMHSPHFRELHP